MGNDTKSVFHMGMAKNTISQNFSQFYEFMNAPYKFEKICCLCLRDDNNVSFEKSKIEEEYNKSNNKNDYSYWKKDLFNKIENGELSTIKEYILREEKCKHFYHKTCKAHKFYKCQFCKNGFSIENAYNFCLMNKKDFRHIMEFYTQDGPIYKINYIQDLFNAVYESIYESDEISEDKKEKIKQKQQLESKFKENHLKSIDFEIPFNFSLSDWNNKFDELLEKKTKEKERKKEKNSSYYNENSSKSSSPKKKESSIALDVCGDCYKRCFICGKSGSNSGNSIRAHVSCNEDNTTKNICAKCGGKIRQGEHHIANHCLNCFMGGKVKKQVCYFCNEKL